MSVCVCVCVYNNIYIYIYVITNPSNKTNIAIKLYQKNALKTLQPVVDQSIWSKVLGRKILGNLIEWNLIQRS